MIVVQNLTKTFKSDGNTVAAIRDVSFQVSEGQFYVLLGPSGSGKTTTLRTLAALEQPDGGEIRLDGKTVYSSQERIWVPPEERPVGMVFQSYALWPHMTVYENIAFPLRRGRRGIPKRDIPERVEKVLCTLDIGGLRNRRITALSGGQQQRVALARALALEPRVLLMDEPLSNLDAKLRAQLRLEIKQLTQKLAITTVHVTHDQIEAMVMGDTIAVMHQGKLLQVGSPEEVYRNPQHLFVAQFLGETNFIQGTLREMQESVGIVTTDIGEFRARFPSQGRTGLCRNRRDPTGGHKVGCAVQRERGCRTGGGSCLPGRRTRLHGRDSAGSYDPGQVSRRSPGSCRGSHPLGVSSGQVHRVS